jgi:mRNA interferase MazF
MDLRRGAIWWADLAEPLGSEPGYRRPVLIVQDDRFNESNLATVIVLALTSNLKYGMMPGNVLLTRGQSGLAKDSIANATQLITIDKRWLDEYVGDAPASAMRQIEHGLRTVLGL